MSALKKPTPAVVAAPQRGRPIVEIEAERAQALATVRDETWRQTTRGVHFGGTSAFFTHCSPGSQVDPLLIHTREKVATTAPHGVRLAELLLEVGEARSAMEQEKADGLLRQCLAEAELLLGRLRNRDV